MNRTPKKITGNKDEWKTTQRHTKNRTERCGEERLKWEDDRRNIRMDRDSLRLVCRS
jgi:hypothetical protein